MRWKAKKGLELKLEDFGRSGNDKIDVTFVVVVKRTQSYIKELK